MLNNDGTTTATHVKGLSTNPATALYQSWEYHKVKLGVMADAVIKNIHLLDVTWVYENIHCDINPDIQAAAGMFVIPSIITFDQPIINANRLALARLVVANIDYIHLCVAHPECETTNDEAAVLTQLLTINWVSGRVTSPVYMANAVSLYARRIDESIGTPDADWRVAGLPDPHSDKYELARSELCLGEYTDDQIANLVYMTDGSRPSIVDLLSGKPTTMVVLTAAKERIRWLSRKLSAERQKRRG